MSEISIPDSGRAAFLGAIKNNAVGYLRWCGWAAALGMFAFTGVELAWIVAHFDKSAVVSAVRSPGWSLFAIATILFATLLIASPTARPAFRRKTSAWLSLIALLIVASPFVYERMQRVPANGNTSFVSANERSYRRADKELSSLDLSRERYLRDRIHLEAVYHVDLASSFPWDEKNSPIAYFARPSCADATSQQCDGYFGYPATLLGPVGRDGLYYYTLDPPSSEGVGWTIYDFENGAAKNSSDYFYYGTSFAPDSSTFGTYGLWYEPGGTLFARSDLEKNSVDLVWGREGYYTVPPYPFASHIDTAVGVDDQYSMLYLSNVDDVEVEATPFVNSKTEGEIVVEANSCDPGCKSAAMATLARLSKEKPQLHFVVVGEVPDGHKKGNAAAMQIELEKRKGAAQKNAARVKAELTRLGIPKERILAKTDLVEAPITSSVKVKYYSMYSGHTFYRSVRSRPGGWRSSIWIPRL